MLFFNSQKSFTAKYAYCGPRWNLEPAVIRAPPWGVRKKWFGEKVLYLVMMTKVTR